MWVHDWTTRAACREIEDPDDLFARGAEQLRMKQLCRSCPVRAECLAEALDNAIEWGVWGGMTERERRVLLQQGRRGTWRSVLEAARDRLEPDAASR